MKEVVEYAPKGKWLALSLEDAAERGWDSFDFIMISGEAYVDHPSFGVTIICRTLEAAGYRVGLIPQPDWKKLESFTALGKPRLAFLVSSGNIDSMVNHYSVARHPRTKDYYSPGGKMGLRPDRAVTVYANKVREAFKDVPIIIGGVEASLRRFAHYDYWDNSVRRSIIFDAGADYLLYGMGERTIVQIADYLANQEYYKIKQMPGLCYIAKNDEKIPEALVLPSYKEVAEDKHAYAEAFLTQYEEQDPIRGRRLVQAHPQGKLVVNPPALPLTRQELDRSFALPYMRDFHPMYLAQGGVPAIEEVKHSIMSTRGCFGNCSFCAITFHQGRIVSSRSKASIIEEAKAITYLPDFKGYINDCGGPTANFLQPACKNQLKVGSCKQKQCLYPAVCTQMDVDHTELLANLREIRQLEGVKKVFLRSGLRYDYIEADKDADQVLKEICEHHVSGQLKIAPEHISPRVLAKMGKPGVEIYRSFMERYARVNKELNKDQYLVPYLMSSHPGSTLADAIELALFLKEIKYQPEQVQDFYPTPGTLATAMYYTCLDPRTMEKVYVPKKSKEKAMQRALLQFRAGRNHELVKQALMQAGRKDLIGYGADFLIPPKLIARQDRKKKTAESGKNIAEAQKKQPPMQTKEKKQKGWAVAKKK